MICDVLFRQVAEEMKQGNKVNPEEFDAVTIYVSDIVEFTPLAAKSTANEVHVKRRVEEEDMGVTEALLSRSLNLVTRSYLCSCVRN